MGKVYRKSHDVAGRLREIRSELEQLRKLTEEGDGPLEYCGWRHRVHHDAAGLLEVLDSLIIEAADDQPH